MISSAKKQIRRLLPINAFARGVSVLVGGTAGAQVLLVLAAPLLTRLYSPEDFGLLALYASLLALISVIVSLRYELAIPLPEDDGEAVNIAVLCLILVVINTLLTGLIVLLMESALITVLEFPKFTEYLWLLPVGVLLIGTYSVFEYWAVRTKRFTKIAVTKLSQVLATLAIQLAAFKLGGIALLIGQVAGQSVGTVTLASTMMEKLPRKEISWQRIRLAAERYRKFPIYFVLGGLINSAGQHLSPIVIFTFFNPTAAGLYVLTNKVLLMPMSLLGNSVGQVFFANASEAHRKGKVGPLVEKVYTQLANFGLPITLLLIIISPHFFEIVFGESWRQAGEFARWMAPWLFLQFVSSPLSSLFSVIEKQKQGLLFQFTLFVLQMSALSLGVISGSLNHTVILLSISSSIGYIFLLFLILRFSGIHIVSIMLSTIKAFGFATLCLLPLIFAISFWDFGSVAVQLGLFTSLLLMAGRYWGLVKQFSI